ncbi:MAG: hypothetical protein ACLUW6_05595 [Coriobacteriaceae bacterium]
MVRLDEERDIIDWDFVNERTVGFTPETARRRHHRRELPRLPSGRLRQHAEDAGMGDGDLRHAG